MWRVADSANTKSIPRKFIPTLRASALANSLRRQALNKLLVLHSDSHELYFSGSRACINPGLGCIDWRMECIRSGTAVADLPTTLRASA
jgi:hypothetical protein